MATSFQHTLVLLLFHCLTLSTTLSHQEPFKNQTSRGFSAPLINRDSPLSPFYNPNLTSSDLWDSMQRLTTARVNYFKSYGEYGMFSSVVSPIVSGEVQYHLKYGAGTPPVDVVAAADTGSSIVWIQCLPCENCKKQPTPYYDPTKSSTYAKLPCGSNLCSVKPSSISPMLTTTSCRGGNCSYYITYADGSYSTGELVTENLSFTASGVTSSTLNDIVIGCGHDNYIKYGPDFGAIVGLSGGTLSLISQLKPAIEKFSYCIPHYDDKQHQGLLIFGDGAVLEGNPTDLTFDEDPGWYYVDLLDLSVGSVKLNLPRGVFYPSPWGSGGTVIDLGTPLAELRDEGYQPLVDELEQQVNLSRAEQADGLCFLGTSEDLVAGKVPTITFHFVDLDVVVSPVNAFWEMKPGLVCLTIRESSDLSIIGAMLQQNMNMGYDLASKKLYMSNAVGGCPQS